MKKKQKLFGLIQSNPDWDYNQLSEATGFSPSYCYKIRQDFDNVKDPQNDEERIDLLEEQCDMAGIPLEQVKHYWFKNEFFSIFATKEGELLKYEDVRDELIKDMKDHAPKYPKIKRKVQKDSHLLIVDPADLHLGKLSVMSETGDSYNIKTATQRCLEGVQGLLDKSNGFNIGQVLLVIGNDILHTDTPFRKTTAGTPQDTDGMWHEAFIAARKLYVQVIENLTQVADVRVVYNPSNHDYISGYMLADALYCWFHQNKNVTFDTSIKHNKFYKFGQSLIGTTHGDGAKKNDLPQIMATEAREDWAKIKYGYWYTHHVHHFSKTRYKIKVDQVEQSKEFIGVTVESLRSPSAADSWHYRNGYIASKAVEGYIHSPTEGQVAKLTHYF